MSLSKSSSRQHAARLPHDLPLIAIIVASAVALLGLLLVAAKYVGMEPWRLFADATSIANSNPLSSAISSLGIMAWTASAAMTLLAGAATRTYGNYTRSWFLLIFGGLCLLLAIDDQFLLHEWFLPLLPFGSQSLYVALYGLVFAGFVLTQRTQLRQESPWIFGAAVLFLAGSVAFDTAGDALGYKPVWAGPVEDSLKFIGVTLWLGYAVRIAWGAITHVKSTSHNDIEDWLTRK